MNVRLTLGTVALTVILAACGTQDSSTGPIGSVPDNEPTRTRTVAPLLGTDKPEAIPGQYIVVLSEGALEGDLSAQSGDRLISSLGLNPQGITIQHIYGQAIGGFAAKLSAQNLSILRQDPRVKYIEQDGIVRMSATQTGATWGLDRVDQRDLPLNSSYTYDTTASGVKVYVIDTGVNTAHSQFGGRATWGTNTTGDSNNSDCQGHGTHVAGTVAGSTYGVAKGASIIAVKVLGCDGTGTNSGVIAGINWAVTNKGSATAIANMSLGGGASQATDDAVSNASNKNLVMVVAAGNEDQNACNVSPARAPSAITVGATMSTDRRPDVTNWGRDQFGNPGGSNYGSCLDLFAPGDKITSAWIGSTSVTRTISGTSMASPHVAGAAALILAGNPTYTSAQITSAIVNSATTGKVTNAGTGSPNRLLYTGTGTVTPPPPTSGTTTYTGTVSRRTSSYKPSSTGFSYAGGTLKATLSGPSGTDFDLYLQKRNASGTWSDVSASEGSSSSESITYNAASGTYRWEVYAYSGSGSYTVVETK